MAREYIEQREGGYWISGTRVSLDSVVYAFVRGASPESIVQSFPILRLEEVYGAITFYLSHQEEVDSYLGHDDAEFEHLRERCRKATPGLYRKLQDGRARQQTKSTRQ